MARTVKVGLIQMSCEDDVEKNVERTCEHIRKAARDGAQIICTQELFRSPYFCQEEEEHIFDLAEPIPGPTTERLQQIAKEEDVVIVGSLFERRAAGVYHNTAAIIDAGGEMLGMYRKMHIPDDPHYYEKYYFTPGDLGFRSWKTKYAEIGVLICWDQWFPEGARLTAMAGAEILFYPTAIGWHQFEKESHGAYQHNAWETVQRGHAIANGVWLCAINRVGTERDIQFFGQSFVADPFGHVVTRGSSEDEQNIIQEVDLDLIEVTRRQWPFLRDRRIDAYSEITERFRK